MPVTAALPKGGYCSASQHQNLPGLARRTSWKLSETESSSFLPASLCLPPFFPSVCLSFFLLLFLFHFLSLSAGSIFVSCHVRLFIGFSTPAGCKLSFGQIPGLQHTLLQGSLHPSIEKVSTRYGANMTALAVAPVVMLPIGADLAPFVVIATERSSSGRVGLKRDGSSKPEPNTKGVTSGSATRVGSREG